MSYTGKYALAKHETLALKYEALERQIEEYKTKEQKRKGASLNELMQWSVKELAELVVDLNDEHEDLERQLEKKEKMIKSFYKVRHEFLLIEIEKLKNIRNKTRFPDHACKMLNNRILELERIYNLHKEKGGE